MILISINLFRLFEPRAMMVGAPIAPGWVGITGRRPGPGSSPQGGDVAPNLPAPGEPSPFREGVGHISRLAFIRLGARL